MKQTSIPVQRNGCTAIPIRKQGLSDTFLWKCMAKKNYRSAKVWTEGTIINCEADTRTNWWVTARKFFELWDFLLFVAIIKFHECGAFNESPKHSALIGISLKDEHLIFQERSGYLLLNVGNWVASSKKTVSPFHNILFSHSMHQKCFWMLEVKM